IAEPSRKKDIDRPYPAARNPSSVPPRTSAGPSTIARQRYNHLRKPVIRLGVVEGGVVPMFGSGIAGSLNRPQNMGTERWCLTFGHALQRFQQRPHRGTPNPSERRARDKKFSAPYARAANLNQ